MELCGPTWWKRHWERSALVTVELSDLIPEGWRHWMASASPWSQHPGRSSEEAEMLAVDGGRTLGPTRMVARRNERPTARLDVLS